MTSLLSTQEFWQYLSIPVIAALIGWTTNWLAIKMTFYPLEFIGKPPLLGWQGIIPSKARKMAAISVDATISKIGTVREIFQQIDPKVLATHIVHSVDPRIEEYVDEMMLKEYPTFWENLPASARKMVYDRVRKSTLSWWTTWWKTSPTTSKTCWTSRVWSLTAWPATRSC